MNEELMVRQNVLSDQVWQSQEPVINLILNKGLEYYVVREQTDLVRDIFRTDIPVDWGCMDGRFNKRRIATAGPGVFWTPEQKLKVVEQVKESGITIRKVFQHRDCGAENAVKKELVSQGMSETEAEEAISHKALNLANHLGAKLAMWDGMMHSARHFERSLFLIGTEMFDISLMPALYPFQLNVRFSPDMDAVLKRIDLAIDGIAFGSHGPGKQKFQSTPFVICVVGDSTKEEFGYETMKQHLQPMLQGYGDLVEVRGFDVPKKYLPNR